MNVGIVGAGRIGGNCARQFAKGGHEVKLSFARDPARLEALADEIGDRASVGTPREAAEFGEVVVLSVLWDSIDDALAQAGALDGKIVIDTSNEFGSISLPADGETAAQHNAARLPGARYTKSFNTLTSGFQAEVADRSGDDRVVQWICGDDPEAKRVVAGLISDSGYLPVDLGGTAHCAVMEGPRRTGAVFGEEYRQADAERVVEALRAGEEIPPTPTYS
jgi:8-hydroxy-5-deazaflavin:NADPH oxidoreductase